MNAKKLQAKLRSLRACSEAVGWTKGKSLRDAWDSCERADWMLWLVGRMAGTDGWPTRQQIVLVACLCAERALPIFEKKYPKDERPRKAIEAARAWANGTGTKAEARSAAAAADAYAAAAAAYAAAAASAAAAAYAAAAYAAAAASAAAASAADAAAAASAADAAAYDAFGATRLASLKEMADLVRQNLQIPTEGQDAAKAEE